MLNAKGLMHLALIIRLNLKLVDRWTGKFNGPRLQCRIYDVICFLGFLLQSGDVISCCLRCGGETQMPRLVEPLGQG